MKRAAKIVGGILAMPIAYLLYSACYEQVILMEWRSRGADALRSSMTWDGFRHAYGNDMAGGAQETDAGGMIFQDNRQPHFIVSYDEIVVYVNVDPNKRVTGVTTKLIPCSF